MNNISKYKPLKNREKVYIVNVNDTLMRMEKRDIHDTSKIYINKPIEHVVTIVRCLIKYNFKIIFLTSVKEFNRNEMCEWLQNNIYKNILYKNIINNDLFMRTIGDNRKDYIINMELFNKYIRYNYNILSVIDNRKEVIERCWNILGVNVINV